MLASMTAREMIRRSLLTLGAIGLGESVEAGQASDALISLNEMLDTWNLERLTVPYLTREEYTFTPGQQTYTYGSGGNFNGTRPYKIDMVSVLVTSSTPNIELPVEMLSDEEWRDQRVKDVSGTFPTQVQVEYEYPLIKLNFWPIPSVANKAVIYSWNQLANIASLDTVLSLPPGYQEAIRWNLAMKLCPFYGKPATQEIVAESRDTRAKLKRSNVSNTLMKCDGAVLRNDGYGTFNWLTGE
jgi:hypothetical protein